MEVTPQEQTVFVVDDDPRACKSVSALVASLGRTCKTFASAEEFLCSFDPKAGGCLVTDLRLTGADGLELQKRLTALESLLPVILVSGYANVETAVEAMKNGALTVIEKPYTSDKLADAIEAALEFDRITRAKHLRRLQTQHQLDALEPRERQVLDLIVSGVTNKAIARRLVISHRTVDRVRAAVLKKLGVESAVEAAMLVSEIHGFEPQSPNRLQRQALAQNPPHRALTPEPDTYCLATSFTFFQSWE